MRFDVRQKNRSQAQQRHIRAEPVYISNVLCIGDTSQNCGGNTGYSERQSEE